MRRTKPIVIFIITFLFVILYQTCAFAAGELDPSHFDPSGKGPSSAAVSHISDMANPVIGTIKVIGIVVAVVMLLIMGIKYLTGSVSEKAEYKKTMIPYLIGVVLVISITQIIGFIIKMVNGATESI